MPKNTYIDNKLLASVFLYRHGGMEKCKLDQNHNICELKVPERFLFVVGAVGRNYKSKTFLLLPCLY